MKQTILSSNLEELFFAKKKQLQKLKCEDLQTNDTIF